MTSLPRRLPQRGPVKSRWDAHRKRSRALVVERASGRCEAEECSGPAEQWDHLFQRRHIIGEPWASSPALTVMLCHGCHSAMTDGLNPDLRERMRWLALVRLCAAEGVPLSLLSDRDALGAIREVDAWLRASG